MEGEEDAGRRRSGKQKEKTELNKEGEEKEEKAANV